MANRILIAILTTLCLSSTQAAAQDFARGLAAYDSGDYETALANIHPLAELGGMAAQYQLGLMYAGGHGVEQDHVQAVHWFGKAAEQGNPDAQYELAIAINNGLGIEKDLELSYR